MPSIKKDLTLSITVDRLRLRFLIRRELEPSMLNGDAHHSLSWELSYAFGLSLVNGEW